MKRKLEKRNVFLIVVIAVFVLALVATLSIIYFNYQNTDDVSRAMRKTDPGDYFQFDIVEDERQTDFIHSNFVPYVDEVVTSDDGYDYVLVRYLNSDNEETTAKVFLFDETFFEDVVVEYPTVNATALSTIYFFENGFDYTAEKVSRKGIAEKLEVGQRLNVLFYSSFPSEDALNEEFCANEIDLCTYYYVSQFISPDISEFNSSTELASDSFIFPYQLEILKDEN